MQTMTAAARASASLAAARQEVFHPCMQPEYNRARGGREGGRVWGSEDRTSETRIVRLLDGHETFAVALSHERHRHPHANAAHIVGRAWAKKLGDAREAGGRTYLSSSDGLMYLGQWLLSYDRPDPSSVLGPATAAAAAGRRATATNMQCCTGR